MLRYPGGKSRAVNKLDYVITEEKINVDCVYSPFYGGGSFELFLRDKYGSDIVANDAFAPLISFWSELKADPVRLTAATQKLKPMTKAQFTALQGQLLTLDQTDQAAAFFALNRSSFNGGVLSSGYSAEAEKKRFTQSSIDQLSTFNSDKITYTCSDFADFIDTVPDGEFMFLDPPYLIDSHLYGSRGDLHRDFDHQLLANKLRKRRNWLLCYNNTTEILDMYQDEDIGVYETSWAYGMSRVSGAELVLFKR